MGLEYCIQHHYVSLIMEIDCLTVKINLDYVQEVPWSIENDISKTKALMKNENVQVEHTYVEGNKMEDFIANHVLFVARWDLLTYSMVQAILKQATIILSMDKNQIHSLRIKKY